jgi:hypothetical protein
LISAEGKNVICKKCGYKEALEPAVMRSVKEFQILFPDRKITTNTIYDWCEEIISKRRIRRILKSNYKKVGVRQWTYYE